MLISIMNFDRENEIPINKSFKVIIDSSLTVSKVVLVSNKIGLDAITDMFYIRKSRLCHCN